MFDVAWSEMAVIAAVALVLIGPKDMPVAIRSITGMIKKARRMAGEFQTHVDEMLREANLDEVKNSINDIRNFDLKTEMERTVDPDGTLRDTFAGNPLDPTTETTPSQDSAAEATEPTPDLTLAEPADTPPACTAHAPPMPPAFMPPSATPPALPTPTPDDAPDPPAFIPPEVARAAQARLSNG
jgi:sec-independent protein translocase protein TatB